MALVFTRHARGRILERGIRIDEIHVATEAATVLETIVDKARRAGIVVIQEYQAA